MEPLLQLTSGHSVLRFVWAFGASQENVDAEGSPPAWEAAVRLVTVMFDLHSLEDAPEWLGGAKQALESALHVIRRDDGTVQVRRQLAFKVLCLPVMQGKVRSDFLNAVGCMEKRCGNPSGAVKYIQDAVVVEGGLVVASPQTLLNLSACMLAAQRNGEAAALARQAVSRLNADVPKHIFVAAQHNLAVAMEAVGELDAADGAYRSAEDTSMTNFGETHPTTFSIQRSYSAFLSRTHYCDAAIQRKEWEMSSKDSLTTHAKKVLQKSSMQAAMNSSIGSIPVPHVTPGGRIRAAPRKPVQLPPSVGVYHLPPLRVHNSGVPSSHHASAASSTIGTVATNKAQHQSQRQPSQRTPDWNDDPIVAHSINRGPVRKTIPVNWEVENSVAQRYIPRWLVPALEDLIYKQDTRRNMLVTEEARARISVLQVLALNKLAAKETEIRVTFEATEYRNRRQLLQWTHGKAIFLEGRASLEDELDDFLAELYYEERACLAPIQFDVESTKLFYYEPVRRDLLAEQETELRDRIFDIYNRASRTLFTALGMQVPVASKEPLALVVAAGERDTEEEVTAHSVALPVLLECGNHHLFPMLMPSVELMLTLFPPPPPASPPPAAIVVSSPKESEEGSQEKEPEEVHSQTHNVEGEKEKDGAAPEECKDDDPVTQQQIHDDGDRED